MESRSSHHNDQKRIRILLHTQYYPPEIGAPQSRLSDLAFELNRLGFQVTVLTAMPNYPTGKIIAGYGGWYRKETIDGVNVIRTAIYPTQSAGFIKRLLNYFSFVISSFFVGVFLPRFDFIITESPPLFLGISGYLLSRIKKSKWIFNVADLWPESVVELGLIDPNGSAFKISSWLESFFYRNATLVTGQSKTILENIQRRFPEVPTYLLSNGVRTEKYQPTCIRTNETVTVMYAGLHGLAQGLDQIVEAAAKLKDQPSIEFVLIGDGPEKQALIEKVRELNLKNIEFRNPIPKSLIPVILSEADIILVPLKTQLTGAVPSKLYEAMASGKAVILVAEIEAAEIVRNADCGIVVSPGDVATLADSIHYLAAHPDIRERLGANGRKIAIEKYDRTKIVEQFADFVKSYENQEIEQPNLSME